MAHQDIRRLTNELDAVKNNNIEPVGMLQRVMFLKTCIECLKYIVSCWFVCFKFVIVSRTHTMYIQPLPLVCPAVCLHSSLCLIVNIHLLMCSPLLAHQYYCLSGFTFG